LVSTYLEHKVKEEKREGNERSEIGEEPLGLQLVHALLVNLWA
jgi:hypothetical protein